MRCVTLQLRVRPVLLCGAATWGYSARDALVAMKPDLVFELMNDIAARLTPAATAPLPPSRHPSD